MKDRTPNLCRNALGTAEQIIHNAREIIRLINTAD